MNAPDFVMAVFAEWREVAAVAEQERAGVPMPQCGLIAGRAGAQITDAHAAMISGRISAFAEKDFAMMMMRMRSRRYVKMVIGGFDPWSACQP